VFIVREKRVQTNNIHSGLPYILDQLVFGVPVAVRLGSRWASQVSINICPGEICDISKQGPYWLG
jgi:hypothetical protein